MLIKLHGFLDKLITQNAKGIHKETRFAALKRINMHLQSATE
jgi:hypothetical protein